MHVPVQYEYTKKETVFHLAAAVPLELVYRKDLRVYI